MAYTKQTWVDNNLSYPVSAARMTTIENGIEAAASVADTAYALAQVFPNRNRITNGTMQIDQRRGGTAVTGTSYAYLTDHFVFYTPSSPGLVNLQQVVDGPPGVSQYSGKLTVNTVDSSVTSAKRYGFGTGLEGLEIADLAWGTANAKPIVVSFYVKSSLTGTHAFCVQNGDTTRSYVVNYTINAANTWERKSFAVPGDQSGTWVTSNALGLNLEWSIGRGSNFQTSTLNAWQTGNYKGSAAAQNLISTAGATIQITGVQLETGTVVTPFEYRSFGEELQRCQRYYETTYDIGVPPGTNTSNGIVYVYGTTDGSNAIGTTVVFQTPKRTSAYSVNYWQLVGTANQWNYGRSGAAGVVGPNTAFTSKNQFVVYFSIGASWTAAYVYGHWSCFAEIV